MSTITHKGFLGDAEHDFTLSDAMVLELERLTETGIGALYQRLTNMAFRGSDISEVIRLGLIGGGMNPQAAMQLVTTYVHDRPLAETLPLALDVLDARWSGAEPNPKEDAE